MCALLLVTTIGLVAWNGSPAHAEVRPACTVSAKLVNSCRPWLGASANKYTQVPPGFRSQIEYHEQRIGRPLDVVHAYNTETATKLSTDQVYFATRGSTLLFLNWKVAGVWADGDGRNDAVNTRIDQMGASIKALGDTKIMLTLNHEPENDTSNDPNCPAVTYRGTSGTPDEYRSLWRNVRARFDAAGVTNVVWAVNFMSSPEWRCLTNDLYPGDDLVDWVTFDNYGTATKSNFVSNVGNMYDYLETNSNAAHDYASKPWGIGEWNLRNATSSAQGSDYYDQALTALSTDRFPRLKMYDVWDSYVTTSDENRVSYLKYNVYDAAKEQHYKTFANDARFTDPSTVAADPAPVTPPPAAPTDATAPSVPAGLVAVAPSAAQVNLSWNAATDDMGVQSYTVYRDGNVIGNSSTTSYVDTAVAELTSYSYQVDAVDAAGNHSGLSDVATTVTPQSADRTAPTVPQGLGVASVTSTTASLAWQPSTDNRGVGGYDVYQDGVLRGSASDTTYVVGGLAPSTAYTFAVKAYDAAGNRSPASTTVTVTTAPVADATAPTVPTGVKATSSAPYKVTVTWKASTDAGGSSLAGYRIYRSDNATVPLGTVGRLATTFSDTLVRAGKQYTYKVRAFDGQGNTSALSRGSTVTTPAANELQAPTQPTNLTVTAQPGLKISLAWSASKDNAAVAGYRVYRDGTYLASTSASVLTFADAGLTSGRSYSYYVESFDTSANVSAKSLTLSAVAS